jgi:uncharacterized membrane protein
MPPIDVLVPVVELGVEHGAIRANDAGMDDLTVRIQTLNRRLALLERHTAEETAAIRAELAALQGHGPAPVAITVRKQAAAPAPARKPVDLSWLEGPTGLAVAGGAVTLLGIVFVFALAASRGWIGPAVRCSIGGGVSVLLVALALVVRQRYGHLIAALAAAGTGIGGCYVTLYAASRGYHLLGADVVWVAVVLVAVAASWLALSWQAELLAILGLAAVVIAPPTVEGDLSALGLGASAVAAAAALGLGAHRTWRLLGGLSYVLLFAQVALYVADSRSSAFSFDDSDPVTWRHRGTATVLASVVCGLAVAGAAAYRRRGQKLDVFTGLLASSSLLLSLVAVFALGDAARTRGTLLLVIAAAYGLAAAAVERLKQRDLAVLLVAFALFAIALATATFLSNGGLLVAWTLEGVTFLAVARKLDHPRYQAVGFLYLAAAAVHLFSFETPLSHLFVEQAHPARHIGELVLFSGALAATAALLYGRPLLVERSDFGAAGAAVLLALYAASLALLDLSQRLGGGDLHGKFQRGETMVSALWALVALAILAAGLVRGVREIRWAGLGLLAVALAKLFLFDLAKLSSLTRAASFLAVGVTLLVGGFLVQRLARDRSTQFQ